MDKTFAAGDQVYLVAGQMAEYVSQISDKKHVVYPLYVDDEGTFIQDDPRIVSGVYETPPTAAIDEDYMKLKMLRDEMRDSLTKTRIEFEELNKKRSEITAKLSKVSALKRIDDFIEGRFTHFVRDNYNGVVITTFEQEKTRDTGSYYSKSEMRLLCLFGNSNGDLSWRINMYRDGSGGWDEIVPCCGEEEAKTIASQKIAELFIKARSDKSSGVVGRAISSAQQCGFSVPQDILDLQYQQKLEREQDNIKSLEKQILQAKANIDLLQRETPR